MTIGSLDLVVSLFVARQQAPAPVLLSGCIQMTVKIGDNTAGNPGVPSSLFLESTALPTLFNVLVKDISFSCRCKR